MERRRIRRVPQVRFLNLGLGFDVVLVGLEMPAGLKAHYGKGDAPFHNVQLLSAAAAVEDRRVHGTFS